MYTSITYQYQYNMPHLPQKHTGCKGKDAEIIKLETEPILPVSSKAKLYHDQFHRY